MQELCAHVTFVAMLSAAAGWLLANSGYYDQAGWKICSDSLRVTDSYAL